MEPKTEQQTNERAARLAELTERAKQVAEEIHKEVCAVNRTPDVPYISVYKSHQDAQMYASIGHKTYWGGFRTVEQMVDEISAFDPDAEKKKEIAELEAKLAALKGGAK